MSQGIRPVDVVGPEMEIYADLVRRELRREWGERAPQPPTEDFRVDALAGATDVRFYLLWVDEYPIGTAEVRLTGEQDPDAVTALVRVEHQYRGYALGQRLAAHCEDVARLAGRTRIRTLSSGPTLRDDRDTRFIRRQGYQEKEVSLRQDLDLPLPPLDPSPGFDEEFEVHVVSGVPNLSICEALCELEREISAEQWTLMRGLLPHHTGPMLQQSYARYKAGGRFVQVSVLRHRESGTVVGATEVQFMPGAGMAEQYETYVLPQWRTIPSLIALEHRNLSELLQAQPEVRGVRVFTPTKHEALIEANRQLGFTDVGYYREWEKDLT